MFTLIAITLTLFLGTASAPLLQDANFEAARNGSNIYPSEPTGIAGPIDSDGRIDITYLDWQRGANGSDATLRFVAHNGTRDRLYFRGYSVTQPWPVVKMGDKELRYYWCGTGASMHFIPPGKSITFAIYGHIFKDHPGSRSRFTVGLNLRAGEKGESRLIQTAPFVLPEGFKKELVSTP